MIVLMRNDTLVGIYTDTDSMLSAMVADMEKNRSTGDYTIETLKF